MPPWSRCLMARIGPALTALFLQCVSSVRSRAENRVDYRYEDYIEDNDRIHIRTHAVYAEQALNAKAVVSTTADFSAAVYFVGSPADVVTNETPLSMTKSTMLGSRTNA